MENNEKAGSEGAVFSGPMAALQQSLERMENGLREKSGFEPMAALRAAQVKLSALRQSEGDTPSVLDQIERFIHSGCAIGVLIDNEDDRWSAQSVLDYWANLLLRAQRQRPEATLAEFDPEQAPELPDEKCPYLGLNAFQENDGPRFFGRSALIEQMVERLRRNRLLAVVGPSGAGKSALIADLLAAGAHLVADDLVQIERRHDCLYATAVAETGLIELRGNGIFRLATTVGVPVTLCVELAVGFESERLPACATVPIAGVELPRLLLRSDAPAAAQVLLALTARRAH